MAYRQRWLDYFDVLDANKSGSIDTSDPALASGVIAKLLGKPDTDPAVKAATIAFISFIALIKEFDVNKDNKVTKDELLNGIEKFFVGKTATTLPAWWNTNVKIFFDALDANKNGELSEAEVVTAIKRVHPKVDENEIRAAREWAIKTKSTTGKYDAEAYSKVIFEWATSPNPTPEASLLTPQFSKLG